MEVLADDDVVVETMLEVVGSELVDCDEAVLDELELDVGVVEGVLLVDVVPETVLDELTPDETVEEELEAPLDVLELELEFSATS